MLGSASVAVAVAAVLCPHQVAFVDVAKGAVVRAVELAGDGLAVFAAPDGRVVVPLADEDSTAVVSASGKVERWRGRVFPMFSADFDRMYVVLPEAFATLSYPDRLLLSRVPMAGVVGARRAACSADGRLAAILPSGPADNTLVLIAAMEGGAGSRVQLTAAARAVALGPQGTFAVVASATGRVEVAVAGQPRSLAGVDLGAAASAIATTPDGRGAVVGLARDGGGEIVGLRIDPSARHPLKERFRTRLRSAVVALAAGEEQVVATTRDGLVVLSRTGSSVRRELALNGAGDVVLLPAKPRSAVAEWSDGTTP